MDEIPKRSVRIALVDDQALVLKGLSALLQGLAGIEIALEASDGAQLLAALPQRPVDVIVSDIRMPGVGGIELIQRLRESGNATPVILLTTFDDSELMLAAVQAGAQGFLLKDASPEDLAEAIQRVAGGDTLLQPVSLGPVRALRRPTAHRTETAPDRPRSQHSATGRRRLFQQGDRPLAAPVGRHGEELHQSTFWSNSTAATARMRCSRRSRKGCCRRNCLRRFHRRLATSAERWRPAAVVPAIPPAEPPIGFRPHR